ncbi:outer membrane receptor protein involved in Fe transport [Gillisia mitskevichiae]|uniref:Outer membrane receptor protein involved in Fe transport n=1 Tax=Gillisia mitskevichiae TaxID=270921 RepID=A0A495PRW8_9FLAO|nr:outer membrane beta-barrel protein [Gillisia mitskevichiae]RKS52947.1 outer membrane receptor protein involved in Fe transport [Gillisia mitskevichiae]
MTFKKMLVFSFLLIFFISSPYSGYSQSKQFTISGKVIDDALNVPLEYATIAITRPNDPKFLDGGVTDINGEFSIKVPPGVYNITIEFISYTSQSFKNKTVESDLDLGTIKLGISSSSLDEVVVRAETTQVEVRLDKKIYNIGKDLTTKGGTVSDALSNVPSVAVDVEGAISLRGNENVRILINGKPSAMAGFGTTNVLGQLPADAIDRVEVITSPSARYDAEGTAGIINIILRKEKTLGFNGSLTANIGDPENYGISVNANIRKEKFNLFNTTGFNYSNAPGNAFFDTRYFNGTFDRVIENRDYDRLRRGFNTNFGIEYYLTDMSSLTASAFYRLGNNNDVSKNVTNRFIDNGLAVKTERQEIESEDDNSYQFALNYINKFDEKGHQLTADFQYEYDKEKQPSFISEEILFSIPDQEIGFLADEEINSLEKQNEFLVQVDYVRPIGEDSQFEAGYRGNFKNEITNYTLRQQDPENLQLLVNDTLTNIFDYTENVNALYTQYGTKFGDFSFLLGLRLENTQLKGNIDSKLSDEEIQESFGFPIDTDFDNNYLGLFPTVNLIYEIAETENITLGYNRRINRPRGWFINPFPSRSSRTNVFQGNPNLAPAYSSAFDLGYLKRWKKVTLTSSIYYQYETDAFERVQQGTGEFIDGIEIIRTIPINLGTNERIGAEAGILYNPAKWLRLNGSINFFQFKKEGDFNGVDFGSKNESFFTRFSSKVTLPANIDWQTNAFYFGPSENSQTKSEGIFSLDVALSKEVFNENATLSLNARDLLNTRKRNSVTTTDRFIQESEFQWRQRQITLSLTYRFNQKKNQQRKRENNNGGEDGGEFEG